MFAYVQNFSYLCKVKKKHADIDWMVMESHYLESLERESSPLLSDMERQDYIDQINDLKATNKRLLDMIDTLKQTLDTVSASNRRNEELVRKLTDQVELLQKMIKNLEDRNNRHNKHAFGKSSLKKNKRVEEKKSREEDKEDYDGNHDALNHEEKSADDQIDQTKVKSEHLDGERAKRENYTKMNAAKVTSLLCDTTNIPEGMRLIGFKEINEFDKVSYIECVSYQVAILEDEFGVRHEYFVPADAEKAAGRRPHLNTMPGTHGTPEFIADLAADIYQMHTPNYREGIRMEMDKFTCSDNTRMNWLKKGAKMLKPLVELLKAKLLKVGSFLNIDETWSRIRIKIKGDGTKLGHYYKKYIWILINKIEQVAYFLYDNDENDSRGYRPISSFLSGFKGTVASDAYVVYKQLCLEHPDIEHCLCWAHVRAKFQYALEISKEEDAEWYRNLIDYLYLVESEIILNRLTPDKVKERRGRKDVTDTLTSLYTHAKKALRQKGKKYSDLMLQALNYMLNSWDELQTYRKDGRYTIDNLPAERAIRPFTVGRKNSLHYSSEEGVEMAMIYLTIIETAKMWGLQVKEYLTYVWREVMSGNTDYESMTPEVVIARQNS
jgi:hypothetical protein